MTETECPVPSCDSVDPTVSVVVNNSESETEHVTEEDVVFEVSFENGEALVSVSVCEECYKNNRHLTDEYVERL